METLMSLAMNRGGGHPACRGAVASSPAETRSNCNPRMAISGAHSGRPRAKPLPAGSTSLLNLVGTVPCRFRSQVYGCAVGVRPSPGAAGVLAGFAHRFLGGAGVRRRSCSLSAFHLPNFSF